LAKKVVWLAPAPEGQVLEVFLVYTRFDAQVGTESPTDGRPQVVLAGRLVDGRQVMLVARAHPDRPYADQTLKTMQDVAERFRLAGNPPLTLDDRVRLTMVGELVDAPVGFRCFTEMAASSLGKPEFDLEPSRERGVRR
jgi:hypothetical protein